MKNTWPDQIKMIVGPNLGKVYQRHNTFAYEIFDTIILTGDYVNLTGVVSQLYLYQHQDEWEKI